MHAHVRFNNGAVVHPGDEVIVHGEPVIAPYGKVVIEDRIATIKERFGFIDYGLNSLEILNLWKFVSFHSQRRFHYEGS